MQRYMVERDEVLLSLQLILTKEAERARPRVVTPPRRRVESPRPPEPRLRRAAPAPVVLAALASPKLRGDLMLERCWPATRAEEALSA